MHVYIAYKTFLQSSKKNYRTLNFKNVIYENIILVFYQNEKQKIQQTEQFQIQIKKSLKQEEKWISQTHIYTRPLTFLALYWHLKKKTIARLN